MAEFAMTMSVSRPEVVNNAGALQGGLIATLVDVAGGEFGLDISRTATTMTTANLGRTGDRSGRARPQAVPDVAHRRRAMVMRATIYGDRR